MTQKQYVLDHSNDYAMYAYGACMDTKRHIFLTGKAGSGKSALLDYILDNTKKKAVVLAATAAAAANIGGGTIHRFFSFNNDPLILGVNKKIGKGISKRVKQRICELEMLVIDEISMVRADVMDAIDYVLKLIRGNELPFGGVQLVLVGDLYQLPPVMPKEDSRLILNNYDSEYFFDSKAIKAIDLVKIELQKNYRQDDVEFAQILDKVRKGDITQNDLDKINERQKVGKDFVHDLGIVLTTTNKVAESINQQEFNKLDGHIRSLKAKVIGEWNGENPMDKDIILKEGAKVVITKNPTYGVNYFNGMIGRILKFQYDCIVIMDEFGKKYYIEPAKWKQYEFYTEDGETKKRVIGEYLQYPLKLGYAITVHKSQGLTLFTAKLDTGNGIFGSGQLYVALSRIKGLKYLFLENKVTFKDVIVDQRVVHFLKDVNNESILNDVVAEILKDDSKNNLAVA